MTLQRLCVFLCLHWHNSLCTLLRQHLCLCPSLRLCLFALHLCILCVSLSIPVTGVHFDFKFKHFSQHFVVRIQACLQLAMFLLSHTIGRQINFKSWVT